MEFVSVPSARYDFVAIPIVALVRPFFSLKNLVFPFCLLQCVAASYKLLRDVRPTAVVGTGGYVSGPTCLAVALHGVKLVIQEQNSSATGNGEATFRAGNSDDQVKALVADISYDV